ncbi:AraC family transcriptional regulator [Apibacter raozihei]|uniref:AraC family transcriptional regulator n=1 Tax=Apibacter raozihei TaxID=2500547 RepID=UPI000FE3CA86|nr:AraC family transcriptional regulator [Apibacter raozihei]
MKKEATKKIYKEKVNIVLDYINANLHSSLSLEVLSNLVHVSTRHLLRIMQQELKESVLTYIVRQRVERAVLYMQIEDLSLTCLAEMVGYDNPQSFSKAFKNHLGISPRKFVNQLKLKINNNIENANENIRFPESCTMVEEDLNLVYLRIIGKYGEPDIYNYSWNKLLCYLNENNLLTETTRFFGISFNDPNVASHDNCFFYACASIDKEINPHAEFGKLQVKGGAYAVYKLKGDYCGLQEYYDLISADRTYKLRFGISFEEYVNYYENVDERITKIYIPIVI